MAESPDDETALSLMYQCLIQENDIDSAYVHNQAWLHIYPNSERALGAHIETCMYKKKWKTEAVNAIKVYQQTFPEHDADIKLYQVMYELTWGVPDKAPELIAALKNSNQGEKVIAIMFMQAYAAYRLGEYNTACQLFREVVNLDPSDENVWRMLAASYFGNMQLSRARLAVKEALRLNPDANVKSLYWLSIIVYFPMFLLEHGMRWLSIKLRNIIGGSTGFRYMTYNLIYAVLLLIVMMPIFLWLNHSVGISYLHIWLGFVFPYWGWVFGAAWWMKHDANKIERRQKRKPISLKDY